MNSIQSSSYKASLRSKIAVRADELFPGDSMDAIKERMTFTRKMYRMILEEKNIDLFWFFPLSNINPFFKLMQTSTKMNESDLFQLKEDYVNLIIDGMDIDTLCAYARDCMLNGTDGISEWSEEDIKEEIVDLYGEDTLEDLTS